MLLVHTEGSMTTDREQTDREQRRLAGKGDPKHIFTIPRAILPKPSLCDEITATKSVTKLCNEIIASRSVCRGQLTWLAYRTTGTEMITRTARIRVRVLWPMCSCMFL